MVINQLIAIYYYCYYLMTFNQQQYPQYYTQLQYLNRNYVPNIPFNYSELNYYQKLQLVQNQYQYQEMVRQSSYYYYLNQQNINNIGNTSSLQTQRAINTPFFGLNIENINELTQKKIEQKNIKNTSQILEKNSVEVEGSHIQKISIIHKQISNTKSKDIQVRSFQKKKNRKVKIKVTKDEQEINQSQQINKKNSPKLKKFHKKLDNINNNENQLTQFQIDLDEKKQSLVIKIKRIKKQKKMNQFSCQLKRLNNLSVYPPNELFPKIHIGENYQATISQDYYFNTQQYSIKRCEKLSNLKQRLVSQDIQFNEQDFEKKNHIQPFVGQIHVKENNQRNKQKVIEQVNKEIQKQHKIIQ